MTLLLTEYALLSSVQPRGVDVTNKRLNYNLKIVKKCTRYLLVIQSFRLNSARTSYSTWK